MGEPHRRAERNYKKKPCLVFSLPFFLVFFFFFLIFHQECNFSRKTVDRMNKLLSAPKVISSKKKRELFAVGPTVLNFFTLIA